jgi:hypothetical protein
MRQTRVVVNHYGGPEELRLIEEECPEPKPGEVRVKVLAAGVAGWDLVGEVDRLGEGVTRFEPGQIVAALPIRERTPSSYACPKLTWFDAVGSGPGRGGQSHSELRDRIPDASSFLVALCRMAWTWSLTVSAVLRSGARATFVQSQSSETSRTVQHPQTGQAGIVQKGFACPLRDPAARAHQATHCEAIPS